MTDLQKKEMVVVFEHDGPHEIAKPQSQQRRRASKACYGCRKRKTKCQVVDNDATCVRCRQENLKCEVPVIEKRGGYSNVLAGKKRRSKEKLGEHDPPKTVNEVFEEQNGHNRENLSIGTTGRPPFSSIIPHQQYASSMESVLTSNNENLKGSPPDSEPIPKGFQLPNSSLLSRSQSCLQLNRDGKNAPNSGEPIQKMRRASFGPSSIPPLNSSHSGINSPSNRAFPETELSDNIANKEIYNTRDAIEILTHAAKQKKNLHTILDPGLNPTYSEQISKRRSVSGSPQVNSPKMGNADSPQLGPHLNNGSHVNNGSHLHNNPHLNSGPGSPSVSHPHSQSHLHRDRQHLHQHNQSPNASIRPKDDHNRASTQSVPLTSRFSSTSQTSSEATPPPVNRISIHDADIVKDGVITADELVRFVTSFYEDYSPFYVCFIPSDYKDLSRVAAEPALLAVMCTIGARCLEGERYKDLHIRLYEYSKMCLSSMLWECEPRHVRSLIFAVLIFSEWFPGALLQASMSPGETLSRHTRICWPLMGQAVRVANYAGLLKLDVQTNIALHFTDHLLACRLGESPMLNYSEKSDQQFPDKLVHRCKLIDRARLDIVKLLGIANRSLYRSRSETHKLLTTGQYMPILSLIYQLVKKWKYDYREIVEGDSWEERTVMFEFSHFELYVFSIILIPWQNNNAGDMLFELEEAQTYLDIATQAAQMIISHESIKEISLKLKNSPIQWITRLMHAAVFLSKVLIALPASTEIQEQLVRSIATAANTMSKLPPDDQRIYSQPLETICRQFYAKKKAKNSHANQMPNKNVRSSKYIHMKQSPLPTPSNTANGGIEGEMTESLDEQGLSTEPNYSGWASPAFNRKFPNLSSGTGITLSPRILPVSTAEDWSVDELLNINDSNNNTASVPDEGLNNSLEENNEDIWGFLLDQDVLSYLANESPTYSDEFLLPS